MGRILRATREDTGFAYSLNKYTDSELSRFIDNTASQVAIEKGIALPVRIGIVLANDRPSLKGYAKDYWRFPPEKQGIAFDYAAFRDVDVVLLLDVPLPEECISVAIGTFLPENATLQDVVSKVILPICSYWASLIEYCLKSMCRPQDIVLVDFRPLL
ncbi:hypothetical protein [uncultured Mesotoga sp.]|uniref:hypothetical protein n=1 Tax=uncultured Mesotoga sp. TaxID=1184400 RepID=UPI002594B151|nr:hypothetical protein [uncultured Mesotoga sp.]